MVVELSKLRNLREESMSERSPPGQIDFHISPDGDQIVISLSGFVIDAELLFERITEVSSVLRSILIADSARLRLDDAVVERVLPLILAKDMMFQAALKRAESEANDLVLVLEEKLSADEIGFPEFGYHAGPID
jgi:hypothetical protein